jgi:hypothetical protein
LAIRSHDACEHPDVLFVVGGVSSGNTSTGYSSRRPSTRERDLVESSEALALTLVASKNSSSPYTSSACTPFWTTLSKKRRKTSKPKHSLMRVSEEWSGSGSF